MMSKAAFVAVVGRPSVGKSTLVNQLCGAKVAIVSAVPQTTRNAIRGIVNNKMSPEETPGQLVFIDTPGRYKSEKKDNKKLMAIADQAVADSDIVLYVLDALRPPGPEEEEIAALLAPVADRTIAAINKIDCLKPDDGGAANGHMQSFLAEKLPGFSADRCFAVSAKNNEGLEPLLDALFGLAPEGEPFYDGDVYTDQEVDFRIAEIIREQAINRLRDELPHALRVEIADTQLADIASGEQKLWVRAFIVVGRESQKGIVVGKGGTMIKAIRLAALKELRKIFDWKIELDLRVKSGNR